MAEKQPSEKGPYKTFARIVAKYFKDYGGRKGLFYSPFLHAGILVSLASYHVWLDTAWQDSVSSIIPNLLGFSLGTYALLFSLMSGRMKAALKAVKNKAGVPYLDEINATFFHFIFIQTVCLAWAMLSKSTLFYDIARHVSAGTSAFRAIAFGNDAAGFIGYSLLIYSIALVIASSISVYRLARIVDPGA